MYDELMKRAERQNPFINNDLRPFEEVHAKMLEIANDINNSDLSDDAKFKLTFILKFRFNQIQEYYK